MKPTLLSFSFYRSVVIYLILLPILSGSCKKELSPSPSPGPDSFYQLPQGNAPYDQIILDWYKRYGSYILYKFEEKDYQYAITGYYSYVVRPADTSALPEAVNYLNDYWFGFYSDSFLKKYLPFKILLAARAWDEDTEDTVYNVFTAPVRGHDYLVLPRIDRSFKQLTAAQRNEMKINIHIAFASWMINSTKGAFLQDIPVAFFNVSPYHRTDINSSNKYQYGFLLSGNFQQAPTQQLDLLSYLTLIFANTREQIDSIYLNNKIDKQGLVRKKYELLVSFFKHKYNMNIQAIGNKRN